jgi:hypothetical protein
MSIRDKVLAIENRIIDKLTEYTWRTELNYKKSNTDLATTVLSFSTLLICYLFASEGVECYQDQHFIQGTLAFLLALVEFVVSLALAIKPERCMQVLARDFPQGYPSPSRYSVKSSGIRLAALLSLLFFVVSFVYTKGIFFALLQLQCLLPL